MSDAKPRKIKNQPRRNPFPNDDNIIQLSDVKNVEDLNQKVAEVGAQKSITRRDPRAKGLPTVADYDPADVRQAMDILNMWRKYGYEHRVQTNKELQERLEMLLDWCGENGVKPLVEFASLATGVSSMSIKNWKDGIKCDSERTAIIKAFYDTISGFDAMMVTNNKLNPVTYFFRAKNFYDMRDQTDVVVTPNNPLGDTISVEEIEKKYAYLPED